MEVAKPIIRKIKVALQNIRNSNIKDDKGMEEIKTLGRKNIFIFLCFL